MTTEIEISSRQKALAQLASIRYGPGAEPISEPTLWRWCKACGVSVGQSTFHEHEMKRLEKCAEMLKKSYTLKHIQNYFRS